MQNEAHQEQHPDKGPFVVDRLILSGVGGGIGGAAVGLALALSYLSRRSGSNGMPLLDMDISPLAQRASKHPGRDNDVVLVGNRVYLLHDEGMEIIEYDASGTLRVLGSVALPNSERVKIAGDRAYVIAKKSLHIINISDPARPAPLGVVDDEYRFIDLAVEGTRVYLLGLAGTELWVVDVRDPARPDVLSHRNVSFSGAVSLALHQGIAYISSYERSLALFDLRDPRQPEHLGTCIFRNRGQGACAPEPTAQPARAHLPAAQGS